MLTGAIDAFDPDELRAWCDGLGGETFVGSSGRVFPKVFRATPLLRAWLGRLGDLGVEFRGEHRWRGWATNGRLLFDDPDGSAVTVTADVAVLALGGASWPGVGSDGSWTQTLSDRGITVAPLVASNCGLAIGWSTVMQERFGGAPLKNVVIGCRDSTARGDIIITTTGLEGGPIYTLSSSARSAVADGEAVLTIDLRPDLDHHALSRRLSSRGPKESASRWLRRAGFSPAEISIMREASANQLPSSADATAGLAKDLTLGFDGLMPIERAISSAGGVLFDELDESFMLRELPGVFVAGEMLDFDAPTGGYLLQASFSTGVAAARGALAWTARR